MATPVLLISHGFQPNYEKAFTNALAHHGIAVTLVASVRTEFDQIAPSVNAINLLPSMDPSRSIREKICAKLGYVYRLAYLVAQHRKGVVHLIGVFLTTSVMLGILELLLYRVAGRRLLLTVHNLLPHDRHSYLNYRSAWFAYRIPHKLIVHTDKMRSGLIERWGVDPDKIIVMEHGVDTIPETHTTREIGGDANLKLLMFGGVAKYKGVDIALSALALLMDFQTELKIVGACRDTQYESELRRTISSMPRLHRIEWRNEFVPESEVQSIFEDADAVLLPYRHIDQSGVLFTAFRFGVPVIVFDVGAFSQYVTQLAGIVINNKNAAGLAEGIKVFRKCSSRFRRDAIKSYAAQFLWQNTVRPVLEQYSDMQKNNKAAVT